MEHAADCTPHAPVRILLPPDLPLPLPANDAPSLPASRKPSKNSLSVHPNNNSSSSNNTTVVCHIEDVSRAPSPELPEARASVSPTEELPSSAVFVHGSQGQASGGEDVGRAGGTSPGEGGCGVVGGGGGGGVEESTIRLQVGQEKRHSHQSVASTESASSESSVAKRARRLAKKAGREKKKKWKRKCTVVETEEVPSMSPGAKWRRLRNTLKAAHEMQAPKKKQALSREDSFLRKFSTRNQRLHNQSYTSTEDGGFPASNTGGTLPRNNNEPRSFKPPRNLAVQHDGNFMFNWLGVVTVAVLYNLWTCILRQAFHEVQQACHACWFTFDALVDIIYLLDILVQFRTGYLNQGLMVYDSKKLARRYIQSKLLYVDALCLCPLDFLQFYIGVHPMIRFPRFLKVYRTFRFIHMLESRTAYPNLIRVANLTHILFLGAHWFAAFYYMISEAEDFKGKWSYPKPVGEYAFTSRKYLASLFWSTLTLTTIGDLPPPENGKDYGMSNAAYVFVIVSYLIGVFVFATIVGQVGNVINNRNASRQEFERLLDGAKVYMQTHNVPSDLQKRVQRWYDYVWSRGRLNGCDINSLGLLPDKLKTELAIHVNLETLKKVTIFQECQPEFLHDLVLKMKAYIFTPGDLICRRGEVAREMFIIADGVVEIISESGTVLKQMGAGDFFGEIGILNLDGGINRRTADVRSVGYSELFVLSRDDVLGALKDHPDAESIIRDYGQRRLREIEAHRQLVKPLKQLGSASRRLLSMRNMTSSINSTPTAGSPVSSGGGGGGGGSPTGMYHSQARTGAGGKTYTYCYTNEDPESHIVFSSAEKSFFQSVCSNVRRIFHRKVRRQKDSEDADVHGMSGNANKLEGKLAWMPDEQRHSSGGRVVKLCCSTGNAEGRVKQEDYIAMPATGATSNPVPNRLTRALYNSPSGYSAVLTEEEENSRCPSPQTPLSPQSPLRCLGPNAVIDRPDFRPCHRLSDVTEMSVTSSAAGQTVAEVNSVLTDDGDDDPPSCVLPRSTDYPEIRFFDEDGEVTGELEVSTRCGDMVDREGDGEGGGKSTGEEGQGQGAEKAPQRDEAWVSCSAQRRGSEPVTSRCTHNRRMSESAIRSPRRSSNQLYRLSPVSLEVFHGNASELSPCIRVESASTLDSGSTGDRASLSQSSNHLHPEYFPPSVPVDLEDGSDDEFEEVTPRSRSNSAPNIVAHALPGSSIHLPPPCAAARLSSAGSSVAVGAVAASPSANRASVFQRRLSSWAKLDGSKRHAVATSKERLDANRGPLWTPATDPLMTTRDPDHVMTTEKEHLASLLVKLQESHAQLHSRMSELEAAYASNAERLDRLGAAQADMLAILTSQSPHNGNRGAQRPTWNTMLENEEEITAL